MIVLGTCSICGGRVLSPAVWYGTVPPIPQCETCHATPASHGPVIPMRPRNAPVYGGFGTGMPSRAMPGTTAAPSPPPIAEVAVEDNDEA